MINPLGFDPIEFTDGEFLSVNGDLQIQTIRLERSDSTLPTETAYVVDWAGVKSTPEMAEFTIPFRGGGAVPVSVIARANISDPDLTRSY